MVYRKFLLRAARNKELLIFAGGVATAVAAKKILESEVVKEAATNAVAGIMAIRQEAEEKLEEIKVDAEKQVEEVDFEEVEEKVKIEIEEEKPKTAKKSKKTKK